MQSFRFGRLVCLISTLWLVACSPDQNWRDVALEGSAFKIQLPCKPDRATKAVSMGTTPLVLQVVGCESGGAMLAFTTTELPVGADAQALMSGWQKATLQNARVDEAAMASQQQAWHRPGYLPLATSLRIQAKGLQPDGRAMKMDAVWGAVAVGDQIRLIHAVVYAPEIAPDMTHTFFESLRP